MIATWVQQFGWTKPENGPEKIAVSLPGAQVATVAQTVRAAVTPPTPSIDREQVHQIAVDLATLEQTVDQLAASQDKIGRNIDRLQGAVAEILVKIPEPPPPPITAVPAGERGDLFAEGSQIRKICKIQPRHLPACPLAMM